MGRTRRNCSVFGCGSSNLARLSNHLAQVHNTDTEERKKSLKWSKNGICVPVIDKDANKKDIHMANNSERLVTLQEKWQQTLITFLTLQRTRRKRKNPRNI